MVYYFLSDIQNSAVVKPDYSILEEYIFTYIRYAYANMYAINARNSLSVKPEPKYRKMLPHISIETVRVTSKRMHVSLTYGAFV